jgi:hypothetical protein
VRSAQEVTLMPSQPSSPARLDGHTRQSQRARGPGSQQGLNEERQQASDLKVHPRLRFHTCHALLRQRLPLPPHTVQVTWVLQSIVPTLSQTRQPLPLQLTQMALPLPLQTGQTIFPLPAHRGQTSLIVPTLYLRSASPPARAEPSFARSHTSGERGCVVQRLSLRLLSLA